MALIIQRIFITAAIHIQFIQIFDDWTERMRGAAITDYPYNSAHPLLFSKLRRVEVAAVPFKYRPPLQARVEDLDGPERRHEGLVPALQTVCWSGKHQDRVMEASTTMSLTDAPHGADPGWSYRRARARAFCRRF